MIRKVVLITGLMIGLITILAATGYYYFTLDKNQLLTFIKENPDRTAITLIVNDSIVANQNANRLMPLASTVKIILAIEYAEQAAAGTINPDELISLNELDKFYVPNTDGGAHPFWLNYVKEKIQNNKISIREIAKGMIRFSSNANTEWLCKRLELNSINKRLENLSVQDHTEIYYIVSALFVGKEKFPGLKGKELETALRELSIAEYIETTHIVHQKLLSHPTYKNDIGNLSLNIQKVWSDNLPGSTTAEYAAIMKKINSRDYFKPEVQKYLSEVMEFLMENPDNQSWLEHSGMKGGSTAFVLTKALYATDKKGNRIELAYFFNDLVGLENTFLQMSMNEFELNILSDEAFRAEVAAMLNNE